MAIRADRTGLLEPDAGNVTLVQGHQTRSQVSDQLVML